MAHSIYTIGHSNISFENFLKLIEHFNINCIIDARSTPYSSYTPHFDKENLQNKLQAQSITYLHFKHEFGARPDDENMYVDGQVSFEKMTQRSAFREGVARLESGIKKGYTIALMCACAHPLSCHCFSMICQYLVEKRAFSTKHIFPYHKKKYQDFLSDTDQADIKIIENGNVLKYFIKNFQELKSFEAGPQANLFAQDGAAYQLEKSKKIGYRR